MNDLGSTEVGNHLGFKILYGDVDHGQKAGRQGPFKGKFALFWPKPATGCAVGGRKK